MKRPRRRIAGGATVGAVAALAMLATILLGADGDPVPDVDVILEQVPGGTISVGVRHPRGVLGEVDIILEKFDGLRLSGDKALGELTIKALPPGWGLRREGKKLLLSGPPVAPPVRFQLEATSSRPARLDVELMQGNEVRFVYKKIVPREVPQRVVAGTLKGTVRLPQRVSPGEVVALRTLPEANLPPGGTWTIAGTVSEPWDEGDLESLFTIVNTTRSNIKNTAKLVDTADPQTPFDLQGPGGCNALAPVAAVLQARGLASISETLIVVAQRPSAALRGTDPRYITELSPPSSSHKAQHDVAMGSIRNLKFFFAIADTPPPSIAINEEEDLITKPPDDRQGKGGEKGKPQRIAVKEESLKRAEDSLAQGAGQAGKTEAWEVTGKTTKHAVRWVWTGGAALAELAPERLEAVALDAETVAGGCRFTPRDPSELDVLRWARMQVQHTSRPEGKPEGKPPKSEILLVQLPDDLQPGDPISVRYLDEWGDPWVDVPNVPDVEVVPPPSEEARGPFIESASPYAVSGDQVCICGDFSPADIVAPFRIAEQPVEAVSVSRNIAWLQSPAGRIGPSVIQAEGFRGEAATDLLRVRAELDQEHLFSGQNTPLRIAVEGTERPMPIRIYNGTPQIIELEGGNEQNAETSGGSVNQVVRQVRGLERGSFQLNWELRPPQCPCLEPR